MPKVLICNRGEIALRALQAAENLGWHAVLFTTRADQQTLAFRKASAHFICPDSHPQKSYLNLEMIEKALEETRCDFLYPGFGFLSENPLLARLCEERGVKFIGPRSDILEKMSNKSQAELFAKTCGIKTLKIASADQIKDFPILLKAARGGGGRGNVIVNDQASLSSSLLQLQKRSQELFSDSQVLIERYLPQGRHVEMQIFGVGKKSVEWLGTRDCSVQRRFQKVVEEGEVPSRIHQAMSSIWPAIKAELEKMDYRGAGTLEFLWDEKKGDVYFLEMNCRIQVEHTVTELLIKENLVQRQLEVASEVLTPGSLSAKKSQGHALQVRIYAEDCDQGFLPQVGPLIHAGFAELPHCRWDLGLENGDEVSEFYDPMIAKLVTWGETREAAVSSAVKALQLTVLHGVRTNVDFLIEILTHPDFVRDQISITWLENQFIPKRSIPQFIEEEKWLSEKAADYFAALKKNSKTEERRWRQSHRS